VKNTGFPNCREVTLKKRRWVSKTANRRRIAQGNPHGQKKRGVKDTKRRPDTLSMKPKAKNHWRSEPTRSNWTKSVEKKKNRNAPNRACTTKNRKKKKVLILFSGTSKGCTTRSGKNGGGAKRVWFVWQSGISRKKNGVLFYRPPVRTRDVAQGFKAKKGDVKKKIRKKTICTRVGQRRTDLRGRRTK